MRVNVSENLPALTRRRSHALHKKNPKASRPAGCPSYTDWGQGLTIGPAGTRVVCAGDTALGARNKLGYGQVWRRDGLTCWSRVTGLTCENARGRGFFLSRESWRRF